MSIFTRILFAFHNRRLARLQQLRTSYVRRREPVTIDATPIRQSGFSLIELLVAVGIAAILSALAAVAYAGYSTKAATSEGPQLAAGAELAMVTTFQDAGSWPTTNAAAAYTPQIGKYSTAGIDGNGNVVISFTSTAPTPLQGKLLYMQPWLSTDGQTIAWQCGNAPAPLFNGQAGTLLGAGGPATTVPDMYLSKVCHA